MKAKLKMNRNKDSKRVLDSTLSCFLWKQPWWGIYLLFLVAAMPLCADDCYGNMAEKSQGYPYTFMDSDGTEIRVEHPFARIISLYPAHTENLIAMGAGGQIVAINRGTHLDLPELKEISRISYRDDPERFLAIEPDLVLIRPMISRFYPNLVKQLRKQGIAVVSLQPSSFRGLFSYWHTLGILSGKQENARGMEERFRQGMAELKRIVAEIPAEKRPRVYFEAIHSKMKTFSPDSTPMFVLETAGGRNVAADAKPVRNSNIAYYGKEKILTRASEIDIFLAQKGRMNPVTVETITNEPGFQVIKAVREGKVYLVDEAIVSRPTMRLLQGVWTIHRILYPGSPNHLGLKQQTIQQRGQDER